MVLREYLIIFPKNRDLLSLSVCWPTVLGNNSLYDLCKESGVTCTSLISLDCTFIGPSFSGGSPEPCSV